jgi:hypothetical protein
MDSREVVTRAIEFDNPPYIPVELVEVPGIWDDYGTLPRAGGAPFRPLADFDSIQAIYSWSCTDQGTDGEGNRLRRDEWGCLQKVPRSGEYTYLVVQEPLRDWGAVSGYRFPDPACADGWFHDIEAALRGYPDKFVNAFIDPGITLVALNMRGYEELLIDYYQDPGRVMYLFEGIWEYQKEIVRKWKKAGAHAVSLYEEWATQAGMYVSPDWWRRNMKPFYARVFDFIHGEGLYTGMGLDGQVMEIVDDLKEIGLDILDNRQPALLGVENLARAGGGRLCVKASCDMQLSLPSRTPAQVEEEARMLARRLGAERGGGFMGLVFKWERIRLPMENVLASYDGFRSFKGERRLPLSSGRQKEE